MTRRFVFSIKPATATQEVLKGLARANMITASTCIVVVAVNEVVAEMLDKLDGAEEIRKAADQVEAAGVKAIAAAKEPKAKVKRQYQSGPLVTCRLCKKQRPAAQMCKTGECKTCRMRALKLERAGEKSQPHEKAAGQWVSGMPKPDGHHEEYLAEKQARPKEKIKLPVLSGRKVG